MGINKIGGGGSKVPDGALLSTAVKPVEKVGENPGIIKGPYDPKEHPGSEKEEGEGQGGVEDQQEGSQQWTAFPEKGAVIVDFTGAQRPKPNALVGKTGVAAYEAV